MSNFQSFDQYGNTPPPYYTAPPPKTRNNTLWVFLGLFGGCFGFIFLCCCCCLVVAVVAIRTPEGRVGFWGGAIQDSNNYDFAMSAVCDGSQAETFTQQMETDGAYFSGLLTVETAIGDEVEASGTIVRNNQTSPWSATFTTQSDDGFWGICISEIREN